MSKLTASEITEFGLYMERLGHTAEQLVLIQKITDKSITMHEYGDKDPILYKLDSLNPYSYEFIGPLESFDRLPSTYPEYLL